MNLKADFFTKRIDSHNESNRFESRIGMLYHWGSEGRTEWEGEEGGRSLLSTNAMFHFNSTANHSATSGNSQPPIPASWCGTAWQAVSRGSVSACLSVHQTPYQARYVAALHSAHSHGSQSTTTEQMEQCRKAALLNIKKVAHTRLLSVGFRRWSRFLAVSLQVT